VVGVQPFRGQRALLRRSDEGRFFAWARGFGHGVFLSALTVLMES